MEFKVLSELLHGIWLMEESAARNWTQVIARVLSGRSRMDDAMQSVGMAKFDNRPYNMNAFYRVDGSGNFSLGGAIQVISMEQPIMKSDYCGAAGTQSMAKALLAAYNDKSVRAVVLVIDSPGGNVDGTEAMANVIKARTKPVIAYVSAMMCSAAYWIGCYCDLIIADNSNNGHLAAIGSIGTMARFIDTSIADEAAGIKVHELYATKSADKNAEYRQILKGDYASYIQSRLDPINESFHSAVKEGRASKINLDTEDVLTGKVYDAKAAMSAGLVDATGTFLDAVTAALSLSSKPRQTHTMKTNTYAFQQVLITAKTDSFPVAEGGFLLSEEQLTAIDSGLVLQEATIKASAAQLKALQDKETAYATAEQAAQDLTTAKARIKELEEANAKLQKGLATASSKPGGFFHSVTKENDPAASQEGEVNLDHLEHNRIADERFGIRR